MLLLSDFYKSLFGCKVYKIALNAGCTCPNRDGSKGEGGCIFCSQEGSGDFIFDEDSVAKQFEEGRKLIEKKAQGRSGKNKVIYLPYFQAFTSTYGNFERLKRLYLNALSLSNGNGLCIATRPDCISDRMLEFFAEISRTCYLQIELGLQTSNELTGRFINRCYSDKDYSDAVIKIKKRAPYTHVVTHIIFGLPGETKKDMLNTLSFVNRINNEALNERVFDKPSYFGRKAVYDSLKASSTFGVKITNLYVLKNTALERLYNEKKFIPFCMEEYFSVLKEALTVLRTNCVLHRFTGDPPKKTALAPEWCLDKKKVLNYCKTILFNNNQCD